MTSNMTIVKQLQAQKQRITMPRRLVIEALGQEHEHLTINDIQQRIQDDSHDYSLSDTTIYRVLQWLKEFGLVSQTDVGQGGIVYALVDESYHHHLICLCCGKTIKIDDSLFMSLREKLHHEHGFNARIEHMAIYGKCEACGDCGDDSN